MGATPETWKDVVVEALHELGGEAHLSEINELVEGHPKTETNETWEATIRRVVRQYRVFEPVPPERSGVYRLRDFDLPEAQQEELPGGDETITHGVAQGMLITLGRLYGYETFVSRRDQTTRQFQGSNLGDLVTMSDCTELFEGPNVRRIREIDVLWFAEDDYGPYPTHAFEVEHTTNVRDGLDRLLKIPERYRTELYIVAPSESEQSSFARYINQTPYRRHRDRFAFREYRQLDSLYNSAVVHDRSRRQFGVAERWRPRDTG
ncbi:MAG: hypothetical protein R6V19_10560 [Armatimonadota bacterium]